MIDWQKTYAAIWRPKKMQLKAIEEIDPISLDKLIGIDTQKTQILENTKAFIQNKPCNNVLLWGARGTGKSSLVKAIFNYLKKENLRVIEFAKEDLGDLAEIVDEIRILPYKFIIFCDDLSFEEGDNSYKGLKPILEGSIELPPSNVLIYATSNRRHLVTEYHKDKIGTVVENQEIHYSDTIEEKTSLSDRFGLWISFYQGSFTEYLKIVDSYFIDFNCDKDELHKQAKIFASYRASRSGRTAKQFYNYYSQII
ncbi:ATP-binding protein [Sulfurospirillum arcachonense]|uniref:ATP-binding protein n=1 Tax=Sulfurospirillum arcachonense TaxID=57666 RepID=UPI0004AE49D7|nr:ATP-binding protein [Sulfurospirillum arcachonense]